MLSAVALIATAALRRPRGGTAGRRVAIALALVIPALVSFTTVGRLWYLPGALLLAAGALVLAGTPRQEFAAALNERRWRVGLLVEGGTYYVFLGATALGVTGVLGILGGALIWAAARTAPVAAGRLRPPARRSAALRSSDVVERHHTRHRCPDPHHRPGRHPPRTPDRSPGRTRDATGMIIARGRDPAVRRRRRSVATTDYVEGPSPMCRTHGGRTMLT